MFVSDILKLNPKQLSSMNLKDLHQIRSQLNSAANKRLKNIKQSGLLELSPAAISVREYRSPSIMYVSRGKDRATTISDISDVMRFLMNKTSTMKGVRSYAEETSRNTGVPVSDLPRFFELYEEVKRNHKLQLYIRGYHQIWNDIREFMKEMKDREDFKNFIDSLD